MCEVNHHLLKIVNDMGLDLIFTDMDRSGIYFADEKVIFLSDKLLENNSDFEISHELALKSMKNFLLITTQQITAGVN